jgi:3-oxoacyl-[acyl-carrier protein] reductase
MTTKPTFSAACSVSGVLPGEFALTRERILRLEACPIATWCAKLAGRLFVSDEVTPRLQVWQDATVCIWGGMRMNLKSSVALITGGSSGIGRAVAQSLAAAGARVAITGRDQRRLAEAARELGVHPIHADVAVEADVERTYREVLEKFGDLDILVNNAGSGVFKNLVDFDRKEFEAVFATNVTGAMLMARDAAKIFVKRQHGNIVNIASTAGLRGAPKGTAYYASKFALRGMTECWRGELRQHNIRVFLVNPSEVLTNFFQTAGLPQKENATKLRAEDIAYVVKSMLEMDDRGFAPEVSIFATNPKD